MSPPARQTASVISGLPATSRRFVEPFAHWLFPPLAVLCVVCVPLFFVGSNVRWVTLDAETYRSGFENYEVSRRTGLTSSQLSEIAHEFIDYFRSPAGRLEPVVTLDGVPRPLFNEREVAHMQDVQSLMQLVFRLGVGAGLYLLVFSVGLLALRGVAAVPTLGRLALWGAGLSIALLLVVAALSLVDFSSLFVRFHELSFSNDLWMLDPSRDYLVMLFPQGFWFDVTLRIAVLTAAESFALGGLGLVLTRA
jgi:integral membrane protein (TIGR01906 family)